MVDWEHVPMVSLMVQHVNWNVTRDMNYWDHHYNAMQVWIVEVTECVGVTICFICPPYPVCFAALLGQYVDASAQNCTDINECLLHTGILLVLTS